MPGDPGTDRGSTEPLARIRQRRWLAGGIDFTLFADRLQFEERRAFSRSRRFIYLGALKEVPDVLGARSWLGLLLAAVLGVVTWLTALGAWDEFRRGNTGTLGLVVIPLMATGAALWYFASTAGRRRHVMAYQFTAATGGAPRTVPWLYLDARWWNRDEVGRFLERLRQAHLDWQDRAKALQAAATGLSEAEMLAKFSSLHDEGILTDEEFALVKSKVVGARAPRIGF